MTVAREGGVTPTPRIALVLLAAAFLSAFPLDGWAQTKPAPAEAQEPEDRAAQARELNRQGVKLLDAGDTERALDFFLRSRALAPSTKNTANAAICLDRLG